MEYFPFSMKTIKRGDITLVDGRTADNPDKLVCRKCWTVFRAKSAAIPGYLMDAAKGELQKQYQEAMQAADAQGKEILLPS